MNRLAKVLLADSALSLLWLVVLQVLYREPHIKLKLVLISLVPVLPVLVALYKLGMRIYERFAIDRT